MKRPNKEGLPSAEAVEGAFRRARTCNRPSRGAIAAALKGLRCEGSSPPAGNSQPGSSVPAGNFPVGREPEFPLQAEE